MRGPAQGMASKRGFPFAVLLKGVVTTMSASVSHKLSNSFEGALAGGGDPASSPLYVFGPFLKLIVVAGVAKITFGASIWLVIFTIAAVSAMYRLVMSWVTDGSGGSGLTEEEFGGWAVKINASITVIEYTLTFLVSMAALVTFIADRLPLLNQHFLGLIQYRVFVAILLSCITGWIVNRGPKAAAAVFGPATLAVLFLLWVINIATIWKLGLHIPALHLEAFTPGYLHFTLAGYARILALMTGVEVFANLVAAYDGTPHQRSQKAFGSLLIIMGTTALTMLIAGPAIMKLSDPTNPDVSVFTQTMNALLPHWLSYLGTLIGIAVLLSASAASAQGLQNLFLGLTDRHYSPKVMGLRNKHGVAAAPVWVEVGVAAICFLFLGTSEELYLSVYAAGVFILLSMTGWAAGQRLLREIRAEFDTGHLLTLIGSVLAALLTTGATLIIFIERFKSGAWVYFILIPMLYFVFDFFRKQLGAPSPLAEAVGSIEEAMWATRAVPPRKPEPIQAVSALVKQFQPTTERTELWRKKKTPPKHILVPLDRSPLAEQALGAAITIARVYNAKITLTSIVRARGILGPLSQAEEKIKAIRAKDETYLRQVVASLQGRGIEAKYTIGIGPFAETLNKIAKEIQADRLIMTTHGRSGLHRLLLGSAVSAVLQHIDIPTILIRPQAHVDALQPISFKKILVPLDGSEFSERILAYVRAIDPSFKSVILLLAVPEVPEPKLYGTMADVIEQYRSQAEVKARVYLESIADVLKENGLQVKTVVTGTNPATTIAAVSKKERVNLIMLATHGRGGLDRVFMGHVADRIVQQTTCPIFLLPIHEKRTAGGGTHS